MVEKHEDLAGTPPRGEYAHRLIIDIRDDAVTLGEVNERLDELWLDERIKYVGYSADNVADEQEVVVDVAHEVYALEDAIYDQALDRCHQRDVPLDRVAREYDELRMTMLEVMNFHDSAVARLAAKTGADGRASELIEEVARDRREAELARAEAE
jgi:hypothetical protein